jgi:hypothetical protein
MQYEVQPVKSRHPSVQWKKSLLLFFKLLEVPGSLVQAC